MELSSSLGTDHVTTGKEAVGDSASHHSDDRRGHKIFESQIEEEDLLDHLSK